MNSIGKIVKEIVFPENIYCIACGKPIKKGNPASLCGECEETLIMSRPKACDRCGRFVKNPGAGFCRYCISEPPAYDGGNAAVVYDREARMIVHALKYGGRGYLAKNIAFIIHESVKNTVDYDIIVPVPTYRTKLKQRGFCQTTLIAGNLAGFSGKPVSKDNLVRTRNTPAMSGLDEDSRKQNVKNAFGIVDAEEFRGKTVLLLDDILTTGSTADECAFQLKLAGAEAVYLAVFASAADDDMEMS